MGYAKRKLALFFTVQTAGVATMIWLCRANSCGPFEECPAPSTVPMILAMALIVGELAVLAGALRREVPVWYALVGLGVLALVTAFICGLAAFSSGAPAETVGLLAVWHLGIGLILLAVGIAAAVWDLLERLSTRDDGDRPDNRQPTAMWPLD